MKRGHATALQKTIAGSAIILLALGTLAGCQPTFLAKEVFESAHPGLPRFDEHADPFADVLAPKVSAPPTVNNADRLPRYLTLQEAIATALESGTITGRAVSNINLIPAPGGGPPNTNTIGFSVSSQNDSIRVLRYNSAISQASVEVALSRFDAIFASGVNWSNLDGILGVPNLGNSLQGSSVFAPANSTGGQGARVEATVLKPMANGAVASMGMLVDNRNISERLINPTAIGLGLLNPQYSVRFAMGFEMPLWRDSGVDINRILPTFPSLSGLSTASQIAATAFGQHQNRLAGLPGGTDGILIARVKFDQSRAHFENNVNALLANTELAYWNLYNKYGQLYSFEESLRIIHKAWQETYDKYKTGGGAVKPHDYFQVKGQYEEFRAERIRALNEVLEAERVLRSILGLPPDDGSRLVPITPPSLAEVKPNWQASIQEAFATRPDLAWARGELTKAQFNLQVQRNNLRPDLRFYARMEPFGDGNTLTGNGTYTDSNGVAQPSNAFRSLMQGRLNDSQIGITLNMPIGFHAEYAAIRVANLELTKTYLLLKDWENQVVYQVAKEYQEVDAAYKRIQAHRAERIGYGESVRLRYIVTKSGGPSISDPGHGFLEAHRRYTAAIVKEYQSIAEYNNALARLEWAKGTILRYDNVNISEGALPQCVQERAVEYERERSRSIVCNTRPDSLYQPGRLCGNKVTGPKELDEPAPAYEEPSVLVPVKNEEAPKTTLPPITTLPPTTTLPPVTRRPLDNFTPTPIENIRFRPDASKPANDLVPIPTTPPIKDFAPAPLPPIKDHAPAPLPTIRDAVPVLVPTVENIAPPPPPAVEPAAPVTISSAPKTRPRGTAGFVIMDSANATPVGPGMEPRTLTPLPTLSPPTLRATQHE